MALSLEFITIVDVSSVSVPPVKSRLPPTVKVVALRSSVPVHETLPVTVRSAFSVTVSPVIVSERIVVAAASVGAFVTFGIVTSAPAPGMALPMFQLPAVAQSVSTSPSHTIGPSTYIVPSSPAAPAVPAVPPVTVTDARVELLVVM